MENIFIRETPKTPEISLNVSGVIEIKGNSFLENAREFYEPIIKWLENYVVKPSEKTVVNFHFNYYNTSSQLWIFRIVEVLLDLEKVGKDIQINWYYSEEEVEEAGMDLANLLGVNINFIHVPQQ